MIEVHNLSRDECHYFSGEHVSPEFAVAQCYLQEQGKTILPGDERWRELPFTYGKHSVSLGDWAALLEV